MHFEKLKEIFVRGKTECRGCGSLRLFTALDLGFSPLANQVIPSEQLENAEPWFPLIMRVCEVCKLGQLGEFASDSAIFRDYPYLSSTSSSWLEANETFANQMIKLLELTSDDLIVELASNDGYLLKYFVEKNLKVLGVEPALNVATLAALKGIPTSPEFFTKSLASALLEKNVRPRLVVAKNVIAHVPDIRDFIDGISVLADETTLIIIEAPSILNIVKEMQFDTIYHEHFSYISCSFLESILPQFNLKLAGIENVATHGGSIRCYITAIESKIELPPNLFEQLVDTLKREVSTKIGDRGTWDSVTKEVNAQLMRIRNWFSVQEGRLIGYGAAAKAVTLLSAAQIPRGTISLCIDNSEAKNSNYIPGSHIKIVSEADYKSQYQKNGDKFIIFPWNLKVEISERIRRIDPHAMTFVMLPNVKEI